jgi:hypothetical protein
MRRRRLAGDFDRLQDLSAALPAAQEPASRAASTDADLDRALTQPLELSTPISIARSRNPELREHEAPLLLRPLRREGALRLHQMSKNPINDTVCLMG